MLIGTTEVDPEDICDVGLGMMLNRTKASPEILQSWVNRKAKTCLTTNCSRICSSSICRIDFYMKYSE